MGSFFKVFERGEERGNYVLDDSTLFLLGFHPHHMLVEIVYL